MAKAQVKLKAWDDWTDPDFFTEGKQTEKRPIRFFLRQLASTNLQQTKLTITGWMLIFVALGIGSAAYNTASNILFMTLSLLLSSLVLSGILSLINFKKLDWSLEAPRYLEANELGLAKISLKNKKLIFPSLCLRFRTAHSMGSEEKFLYLPDTLAAGDDTIIEWPFTPDRRGVCELFLNGVQSKFPFGFLAKTVGEVEMSAVIVWPSRVDFELNPGANGLFSALGTSQSRTGLGSDLLKIREYVSGDAPRCIHWKATARMNRLMVRELAQEGQNGYHLIIDRNSSDWDEAQFETLCSLAYTLANDLFHRDRLQSVIIEGEEQFPMRGLRDLHEFFDRLALLERSKATLSDSGRVFSRNEIRFRPLSGGDVSIYVDGIRAGETKL